MPARSSWSQPAVGLGLVAGFLATLVGIMLLAQTLPGTIPIRRDESAAPAGSGGGRPGTSTTVAGQPAGSAPAPPPPPPPAGGRGAAAPGQATPGETVTLALGGDVHFEPPIRARLANPGSALSSVKDLMDGNDIKMVNLETTITERGKAEPKTYTFRTPTSGLSALKSAGVDVVTAANNHGVDFGPTGLTDTIENLDKSGLKYVGIGPNAQRAYAPQVLDVKGRRIAIFGITQVMDDYATKTWPAKDNRAGLAWTGEVNRLVDQIKAVRGDVDTVVVYVHWGVEGQHCPTDNQQKLAAQLAEAGADAIVGAHAHRLQGYGQMGNAFVAYGLGNFVFYAKPNEGSDTGVLKLSLAGRKVTDAAWTPALIQGGVPQRLSGKAAEANRAKMAKYKACSKLT